MAATANHSVSTQTAPKRLPTGPNPAPQPKAKETAFLQTVLLFCPSRPATTTSYARSRIPHGRCTLGAESFSAPCPRPAGRPSPAAATTDGPFISFTAAHAPQTPIATGSRRPHSSRSGAASRGSAFGRPTATAPTAISKTRSVRPTGYGFTEAYAISHGRRYAISLT